MSTLVPGTVTQAHGVPALAVAPNCPPASISFITIGEVPLGSARRRWAPGRNTAAGGSAYRRAQDGYDVTAADHVAQPLRAGRPWRGAAWPSSAGSLPGQPGPARHPEAGQRPGRILDRRVGDPGPPGAAGAASGGHLARAVLGRRRGAGRARGAIAAARRGGRRAHRAGHGHAAARRVAGGRGAPRTPHPGGPGPGAATAP